MESYDVRLHRTSYNKIPRCGTPSFYQQERQEKINIKKTKKTTFYLKILKS